MRGFLHCSMAVSYTHLDVYKRQVPLIEMPDEKPFIELINALMRVIVDEQNMLLDYRNEIYKKFTDLELNGGGLDRVGEVLFSLLEKPITLFDDSMNQKLEFPAEGYFSHTLGEEDVYKRQVLIFFAAQFTACFNYSNLGTIISVKGADFLQSVRCV